jgi:hypothetical protein
MNCELKKQGEGINVYTCKSNHEQFKTLKAEFQVNNTSLSELKIFLMQIDNYPTWQYNMIHAEVIQKQSDNEISYVSEIDAPWPLQDRESVINLRFEHDVATQQMQIDMRSFQSARPVKEGFLRVPFMHGHWTVKSINANSLQVEYILQIDPGGSIPAWLVNMAMAEGPYVSFINLKKQLEK